MELVTQQLLSPAKINLMLRILSQREDGFHELQTAFQILDWGDEMVFTSNNESASNNLSIDGFEGVAAADNLIVKAAQLIKPWATLSTDWQVAVTKHIPMGGGLGGGSSNAATTLKFLNQAWQCDLSTFDLLTLAGQLGADVPVFILGHAAEAMGRGDVLTPRSFKTPYIVLLLPAVHINTAELFQTSALQRSQQKLMPPQIHEQSLWINDFFPVVLAQFPAIANLYAQLSPYMPLRLSGTGSAMFAVFQQQSDAVLALERAQQYCEAKLLQPKSAPVA